MSKCQWLFISSSLHTSMCPESSLSKLHFWWQRRLAWLHTMGSWINGEPRLVPCRLNTFLGKLASKMLSCIFQRLEVSCQSVAVYESYFEPRMMRHALFWMLSIWMDWYTAARSSAGTPNRLRWESMYVTVYDWLLKPCYWFESSIKDQIRWSGPEAWSQRLRHHLQLNPGNLKFWWSRGFFENRPASPYICQD